MRCSTISSTNGSDFEVTIARVAPADEEVIEQFDHALVGRVLEHALRAEIVAKGLDGDAERGLDEPEVRAEPVADRRAYQRFERGLVVDADANGGKAVHERIQQPVARIDQCSVEVEQYCGMSHPRNLRGQAGCRAFSRYCARQRLRWSLPLEVFGSVPGLTSTTLCGGAPAASIAQW